ncbi:hypothetical protein [Streptomyces sp. NPDC003023]|uniref:hypothetical protein n=1 Tax=Streptomyces sp. NPDC003023 TaxID=3364675 RepID=UPI00367A6A1F
MGGSRPGRLSGAKRPTALLSAVATLLGALFVCLGPARPHHGTTAHSPYESATTTAYSCPYDDGGCGLLPVLSPAVLTVPPPDAPLEADARPLYAGRAADVGRQNRSGALARAPDLHVLQVLRT